MTKPSSQQDGNRAALSSTKILLALEAGDQYAAAEVFDRYAARLIRLARARLSSKLARRVDPEDIVQSAYRSFFAAAGKGRYMIERSGDLWRLLATITLNKLYRQVERHTAAKRDVGAEARMSSSGELDVADLQAPIAEPSPSEVIGLAEEVELVMRSLEPLHRRMLEMRLQGYLIDEIAAETDRTERTVRRVLDKVKTRLSDRAAELSGTSDSPANSLE